MSDFQQYLSEQLKDSEFALFWAFRNEWILSQTAGNMALSGFELTDEDKFRILQVLQNPDATDAVLEMLIQKHTSQLSDKED